MEDTEDTTHTYPTPSFTSASSDNETWKCAKCKEIIFGSEAIPDHVCHNDTKNDKNLTFVADGLWQCAICKEGLGIAEAMNHVCKIACSNCGIDVPMNELDNHVCVVNLVDSEDDDEALQAAAYEEHNKNCSLCGLERDPDGHCEVCFPNPLQPISMEKNPSQGWQDLFVNGGEELPKQKEYGPTDVVSSFRLVSIDPGPVNSGIVEATCDRLGNGSICVRFHPNLFRILPMSSQIISKDPRLTIIDMGRFFRQLFSDIAPHQQTVVVIEEQYFVPIPPNRTVLSHRLSLLFNLALLELEHLKQAGRHVETYTVKPSRVHAHFFPKPKKSNQMGPPVKKQSEKTRTERKKETIDFIASRYGYRADNDHHADAIANAIYHTKEFFEVIDVKFEPWRGESGSF